jgi:hypothetical protein
VTHSKDIAMQIRFATCAAAIVCGLIAISPASARPQNAPGQTFVPGHYAWNARAQQYVWVPSRWERNPRGQRAAGVGWTFSGGRWQFTPGR